MMLFPMMLVIEYSTGLSFPEQMMFVFNSIMNR